MRLLCGTADLNPHPTYGTRSVVPGNTLTDGYVLSSPMLFGTSCRYGYDMIHSERCDLNTRHVIGVWMGVKGKEGWGRGVVPV